MSLRSSQSKWYSTACERCHKQKEKCEFDKTRNSCLRCATLGQRCFPRTKSRMGRRPKPQKLPFGSTSVMHLALDQNHTLHVNTASHTTRHDSPKHPSFKRPPRCVTSQTQPDRIVKLLQSPLDLKAWPTLRSPWQMSHVLDTTEGFYMVHRTFMLGRTFQKDFQNVVRKLFDRSPQVLADGYSVALKLLSARHAEYRDLCGHDLTIGTRCLRRLLNSSVTELEDAAVILLLGQAMLVYNVLLSSTATSVITRSILLSVRPWYRQLTKFPDYDAVTLTPVIMDTVECLVRREVPVVKFPGSDRCIVDRFVGVCSSLLPLLYELCERSYEAKGRTTEIWGSIDPSWKDDYSEVERKIDGWTPILPSSFFEQYSTLEIRYMLAQAQTYRLAALLVIHRLRFPLGIEDEPGQRYADAILQELSLLADWPSDAAAGLAFDFPLLVATLELPERGTIMYKVVEPIRFRRQHSDEILDFVQFATLKKLHGYDGLWFDLVRDRLHGVVLM